MNQLIYIVDDDENVCRLLQQQLINDGYRIEIFNDGESLLDKFMQTPCDLMITDIMMPGISGYDLCREIRRSSDIPIIMVSAKGEEIDRIIGLELGSDDYIAKPFNLREISIKVRNILRRVNGYAISNAKLSCMDIALNKANRQVYLDGKDFKVTAKEYDLLALLISNKNQAFSREQIISAVWGYSYYGDTRQVDHLIKRLRKKMMLAEAECKIETIWGYGYKVCD